MCVRGGSAFGFFKKKKSPAADGKKSPSKEATQNEASVSQIRKADFELVVEEGVRKRSGSATESKTTKVITGPGAAFGAQLAAELKQKKKTIVDNGETEQPVSGQGAPGESGAEKKTARPTPMPRFGVQPKMAKDVLAEMKNKQGTKKVY